MCVRFFIIIILSIFVLWRISYAEGIEEKYLYEFISNARSNEIREVESNERVNFPCYSDYEGNNIVTTPSFGTQLASSSITQTIGTQHITFSITHTLSSQLNTTQLPPLWNK